MEGHGGQSGLHRKEVVVRRPAGYAGWRRQGARGVINGAVAKAARHAQRSWASSELPPRFCKSMGTVAGRRWLSATATLWGKQH